MLILRVGGAFIFGCLLNIFYKAFDLLQNRSTTIWVSAPEELSWMEWGAAELRKLMMILIIVVLLLIGMKLLNKLKVTEFLTRLLAPVLSSIGVSSRAAPIAIIGMTLGLTYGGGLIIQESQKGILEQKDVFAALVLMGLSHSLIEDTLFILAIGAHISGILFGRLFFTLIVVFIVAKILRTMPEDMLNQFFIRKVVLRGNPEA
jgi:hypothetical protein